MTGRIRRDRYNQPQLGAKNLRRSRLLVVLASAGVVVSSYLTLKVADPSSVVCSIGGGCEKVLGSQYATMFGVPVSAYGVAWYLVVLGLIFGTYINRSVSSYILKLFALSGLAFSLYLFWVSRYLIGAYCTWCLASLGLVVLINILVFTKHR